MKSLDLYSKLGIVRAISPVSDADNTAQVSQSIDRQGYSGLLFAIALGAIADADATFTALVEESDDNATFTAVADDDLNGTEAAAGFQFDDDNETRKIGYVGNKRYVRLTVTPTNNASAALVSALAILGGAEDAPVA